MHKLPSHKQFLLAIGIVAILSSVGFYLILTRLSPLEGGYLAISLCYASFFFMISSYLTLLGYFLRVFFYKKEVYFVHLNITLRQGIFLGLLATILLSFQSFRVLTWWDSVLLAIIFVLLEFYFISRSRRW